MDFLNEINEYSERLKATIDRIDKKKIGYFAEVLLHHYGRGSHIFIFGNGGSASTASHAVCDLNKSVCLELDKKFKCVCLNDNIPSVLAYSNDTSYDHIFYLQLENFLSPGDLVIGISGSGNSENVVKAVEYARQAGADTFTLCGFDGGRLKEIDQKKCVHVPARDMQIVEDCHLMVFHMLTQLLYKQLRGIEDALELTEFYKSKVKKADNIHQR
ncbi:MAG: SIS domain-containing protein [Candidatus Omnitrophica bacterium]|nr:SIS domain-containing protein [Candidatus Omnitrophota bacterium]